MWPEGTVVRRFYRKRSVAVQEDQRNLNPDLLGTTSSGNNGNDNK